MTLTRTRVALSIALLAFTFFAVAFNVQPHGWLAWYRLSQSGQKTQVSVTRRQPEIHQTCYFTYVVDSHLYESSDGGCNVPVGQSASATYAPSDPTFITLRSPREEFILMVLGPLVLSVFGGVVGAANWARRERRRVTPNYSLKRTAANRHGVN